MQGHNSPRMKARNRTAVLRSLLERGPMPRRDLATALQLTPATITNVARELIGQQLLEERWDLEPAATDLFRKAVPLDVRADGAAALGINLGRPGAVVGVVDLKGEIRASTTLRYADPSPAEVVRALARASERIIDASGVDPRRVVGVGVGVAGVTDGGRRRVRAHLALGWRDVPLGSLLEDALARHVHVENNVHAMAVSERLYGVGARAARMVLLFVSATIGAGAMIDGQLLRGQNASAGLIGHVVVDPDGPPCRCGNRGCLEAVASNEALVERWHGATSEPGGRSEQLFAAARAGDGAALRLLAEQAQHIGGAVASILYTLDPDLVVIAGPILGRAIDIDGASWVNLVRRAARARAPLLEVPDERIVPSRFGADAPLRGAAAIALAEFLERAPFAASLPSRLQSGVAGG